ncbi:hypothetical protein MCEMSEM23_02297 [Rhabdaerophilaceae bacterium]
MTNNAVEVTFKARTIRFFRSGCIWFWAKPAWLRTTLATLPAIALYSLWLSALPNPSLLITISALSERVEFAVTNPDQAVIPIENMKIFPEQVGELAGCISGSLRPREGAVIAYERHVSGDVSIAFEKGTALFEYPSGKRVESPSSVDFIKGDCPGQTAPRFPIWGSVRLGDEKISVPGTGRLAPTMLLEGTMNVQARAIESVFLPMHKATLYPVTLVNLPTGARVESAEREARSSQWWGSAYIDPQKVALQVQLATESAALRIFRPGRTSVKDADLISVTALTQVFSDPNMIRFQAFVAVLLALIAKASGLFGNRRDE